MLAYAFPPVLASGSNRSVAFSKNLRTYGWEPTVLTVDKCRDRGLESGETIPEDIRIVRTRELNLNGLVDLAHGATRRVLGYLGIDVTRNWYAELLCIPDPQIAWMSLLKGISLAASHDVIYVSCSPFSSAILGVLIKRFSGKPLVLDFRDAWSLNPHVRHTRFHQAAIRRMETCVIKSCDKLIVNTRGAEALYKQNYPQWQEKIETIPNGYDTLHPADRPKHGRKFSIMHVGSFYGSRAPDALLQALSELADPSIEFVQVGGQFEGCLKDRPGVRVVPSLPHDEAVAMMREASLLYLKQGFERGITHYIAVAAKTYEYLATGLPILADCPEGDNADIVRRYCAHPYVVTSGSKDDLKTAVRNAVASHDRMVPIVTDDFRHAFDRVRLTGRLAGLLDEACRPITASRKHMTTRDE